MKVSNITYFLPRYRKKTVNPGQNIPAQTQEQVLLPHEQITAQNNISFHGLFNKSPNEEQKVEARFNSVLPHLDQNSLLLFANDLDNAANLLIQYNAVLDFPLSNIYFVKNNLNTASLAVFRAKDGKYKIFKLHMLDNAMLLEGGKEEYGVNVKKTYINTADEPVELKNNDYIRFGFIRQENFIKTNIFPRDSEKIFAKEVEKISYFENKDNIKKYNASILLNLTKPRETTPTERKITFKDVGGQDENIKILEQKVMFPLKYPAFYKDFRLNKGIMLSGPPRCGKTLLALALANELGINFIKLSADDLTHANVGKTEENWRKVFDSARKNQPSIIFIDEFDAIAKQRSGGDMARYQDNVVNQLLSLMSDLEKSDDMVFVIAATNRKDLIDSALLQPGRFGLVLNVQPPDFNGTKQIFQIHAKNKPVDESINIDRICNMMFENEFTGSDIAEVFSEAHSFALERTGIYEKMRNNSVKNEDFVNFKLVQDDFCNAIKRISDQKK